MKAWIAALLVAQATQPGVQPASSDRVALEIEAQAALVADVLPRRDVVELRPRVGLVLTGAFAEGISAHVDARLDALVADRGTRVTTWRPEIRDAWVETRRGRGDVRVGYGRIAWGRLDEIAPTDVVNPIDAARFLFEGRAEARLPVSFARARITVSERLRFECVVVPVFRRGLFDRLDDGSSPFNLVNDGASTIVGLAGRERREPDVSWSNLSGGARTDMTVGRVDVGVSAFRGFDGLGPAAIEIVGGPLSLPAPILVEHHPRFTMVGADFETVSGVWAWRGEAAVFVERMLASSSGIGLVRGKAVDAGVGFDRRVGEVRVFASGIFHREWSDQDPAVVRTDVSAVTSVERSFARERFFGRAFAVVNPGDRAAFVRGVLAWKPDDKVSIEWSGGTFVGTSDDTIGRFRTRDFVLASLRFWIR